MFGSPQSAAGARHFGEYHKSMKKWKAFLSSAMQIDAPAALRRVDVVARPVSCMVCLS